MNRGVLAGLKRLFVPPPLGGDPANDGMALVLDSTQEGGARASQSRVASTAALVVRAITGQTANLQEWQNSTGVAQAAVNASGQLDLGSPGSRSLMSGAKTVLLFNASDTVSIGYPLLSQSAGVVTLTLRGAASQTADILIAQTNGGVSVARIDKAGKAAFSEATNGPQGVATLVAGTVTVANTNVTANSRIFLTAQSLGTVAAPKPLAVTARVVGTSFTITSADATDTSVVAYEIFEPA